MKKILLAIAAGIVAAAMFSNCSTKNAEAENTEAQTVTIAPLPDSVVISELNNDSLLRPDYKVERVTVIDFNAPWCVPCRMLTPSFDAVADSLHTTVDFYSVNIDMMQATANAFGVQAIPTLVVMTPNDSVRAYVGLDPYLDGVDTDTISSAEVLTSHITPALFNIITEK